MDIITICVLSLFGVVIALQQYIINSQSSVIVQCRKALDEQKAQHKEIKIYALNAVIKESVENEDYERANRANNILKELA